MSRRESFMGDSGVQETVLLQKKVVSRRLWCSTRGWYSRSLLCSRNLVAPGEKGQSTQWGQQIGCSGDMVSRRQCCSSRWWRPGDCPPLGGRVIQETNGAEETVGCGIPCYPGSVMQEASCPRRQLCPGDCGTGKMAFSGDNSDQEMVVSR